MEVHHPTKQTEHVWIAMPDGVRLAARIWWPAGQGPFPAILEYIPYRKRDLVRARDERNHPYFAAHGYVCLRVDMRGSGDSEGHMPDMYSQTELADARHLIEWMAGQDWCTGRVGMFGTSWGGTASLQAAVNAPTALKAVLANCATVDRFEDDIHWMGGSLLTDSLEWGATLPAILAAPPDAATVGDGWRSVWEERLRQLTFPLDAWIRHHTRGEYWRHGSVRFDAERLSCPILAIGGWADRYSNSVMALVQSRPDLCWGIVGPWGHHYPDQGEPGPAIGFQDLALQWWDHWLSRETDDRLNWPRLRLWRREYDPPDNRLVRRNGQWIETDHPQAADGQTLFLNPGGLADRSPEEPQSLEVPNNLRHGECAGDTGYFGRMGGLPLDQSEDDARSLCFDSVPLEQDIHLIGHAELSCEIVRDQAAAQLVCRLCEVTPDGRSNLVVRQVHQLALDPMLDATAPFAADNPARYRIRLPSTAYRFARGNRIRLALGTSYWPLVWPGFRPVSVRLLTRMAQLKLPCLTQVKGLSVPFPKHRDQPVRPSWGIESEGPLQRGPAVPVNGWRHAYWVLPRVTLQFPEISLSVSYQTSAHYRLDMTGQHRQRCTMDHQIEIHRQDGTVRINSSLRAMADRDGLSIKSTLTVHWNQEHIIKKVWRSVYPAPASDVGPDPDRVHPP